MMGEEHYAVWGQLVAILQTGENAFEKLHGAPIFDWMSTHPEQAKIFDEAMTGIHVFQPEALSRGQYRRGRVTGADLDECKALGDRVNASTASMGVAFTSCTVPDAGAPTFDIGPDEIEVGVGIHGEPGRQRRGWLPASDIVGLLLDAVLADLRPAPGRELLLHVNGFGGTPLIELHLLNRLATRQLQARGLQVKRWLVGNLTTSLEMAGASLTLTALDAEMLALWDAPVHTATLRW